ncbi:hypothetical protein ACFE04_014741 [Oxalis oulophora]
MSSQGTMKFKVSNNKFKLAAKKPTKGYKKSRVVDKGKREGERMFDSRKKRVSYAGKNNESDREFGSTNSDRRNKRVYASKEDDYKGVKLSDFREATKMKAVYRKSNVIKSNLDSVKENVDDNRTMWSTDKTHDATSKTRQIRMKVKDMDTDQRSSLKKRIERKSDSVNLVKNPLRTKKVNDMDVDDRSSLKKIIERKPDSVKLVKNPLRTKKDEDDKSEVVDEQPRKKKKFLIKLDPYDISNKRLDDEIVVNESTKEKMKKPEDGEKMSMNAQFRAIKPSTSILSYVEDNLLGRRRLNELRRAGYNIDLPAPLDNIPNSTSPDRERIEESVFRNHLSFFAAAKVSSSFPPADLPEIAFAGRSNVGKSSLLNSLTRQWGVVRTSDKPGHTQTINFFNLGSKVCLVDLPGYGFAYAKEEVKDAWEDLVKEYVSMRVGLKRVCLLIDTQWGMKPRDHELIDLMERYQTKYQIVLTKTDNVFPIDVARRAMQIEESLKTHKSAVQPLMMVSSKSGAGIQSLRAALTKIARFAKC